MVPRNATRQRERRVIVGGAAVVVFSLLITYVLLPFAREWSAREAELSSLHTEADSLAALIADAPQIERAASDEETVLASSARRVLHARSAPLAASALQSLLQDAADASRLVVTRLDVAQEFAGTVGKSPMPRGAPRVGASGLITQSAGTRESLPATLAAYCDVVGLADFLDHLARSPRVVVVDRLTVQQNSALRGAADMLQITVGVRAPVVIE